MATSTSLFLFMLLCFVPIQAVLGTGVDASPSRAAKEAVLNAVLPVLEVVSSFGQVVVDVGEGIVAVGKANGKDIGTTKSLVGNIVTTGFQGIEAFGEVVMYIGRAIKHICLRIVLELAFWI
ncbi:hypothetical protein SNE40_008708 [Patella caerulea]|uniref:Uncharacterized protein n=1 Tax=Patella caerulea TaxID=87958 RepID=A0AAN8JMG4_PATCE